MKRHHIVVIALLLLLATGLGWWLGTLNLQSSTSGGSSKDRSVTMQGEVVDGVVQDGSGKTVKYWYDPMVPNQKFDKPGKSPFMDMQLEPKYANAHIEGEGSAVSISAQTVQNLGIRLEKVSTRTFGETLSAVGRIEPDERRINVVQTRVPGFIERLLVRAVGDPVTKGQKIAEIYAPELLAAQQEYLALIALRGVDQDNALKNAAHDRLRLLGMSEGEINAIKRSSRSSPRFGVYAPTSGIITELGVRQGGQLMAGSSLMQISDLSQVWLIAEVPERDAARLKPGISADVQLQSLPGEVFKGKIGYLYPILNDTARTLQVRIELPNKDYRLRPGMYGNALFTGQTHEALSTPTESIIATGKRKIVIVKEENGYRAVEVETGQEHDRYTEILTGLSKGEEVVISGQFLIDSEASLSGALARLSQHNDKTTGNHLDTINETPADTNKKMPEGRGKVIELDTKSNHITLYHEPITALGWPAMTMGFKVKSNQELSTLKPGDEVKFDLKVEASDKPDMPAQYRIEHIEKTVPMKREMKEANP